ncbi:MAG: GntR family transcriptional regulator, partial [Rhodococcus sp. (in: high G+C Gram-positive bacteria)]|uniref:GntR family transcriptional regulator n=1 Tax=Rhodococcus sp. TaxID=1831 RepID=UPI003BB04353
MPTSTKTRAETVFDSIRDEVLAARIPPGTKMKLADYGQRFDVSLSVVREAMGRLAEQGLLQANPQRGFSTLPLSVDDLLELTRARVIIETAALRESIERGNLEWEAAVVGAHHRLASTAMYADDGATINREFAVVHRDFHVALLAGSGNPHLDSIAASLRDRSELYLYWSRYLGDDPARDVACEHRQL